MATVVITFKIMPESPEVELDLIEKKAKEMILAHAGPGDTRTEIEPIAFGLKAIKITFIMDERFISKIVRSPRQRRASGLCFLHSDAIDLSAFLELWMSVNASSFIRVEWRLGI